MWRDLHVPETRTTTKLQPGSSNNYITQVALDPTSLLISWLDCQYLKVTQSFSPSWINSPRQHTLFLCLNSCQCLKVLSSLCPMYFDFIASPVTSSPTEVPFHNSGRAPSVRPWESHLASVVVKWPNGKKTWRLQEGAWSKTILLPGVSIFLGWYMLIWYQFVLLWGNLRVLSSIVSQSGVGHIGSLC